MSEYCERCGNPMLDRGQPICGHCAREERGLAPEMGSATDWKGNPITDQEPPEKMIRVWQIEPHPTDSSYDACLCRSYQQAVEVAKLAVENTIDQAEDETLVEAGITVKVKVIEMRKCDYEAEIADD